MKVEVWEQKPDDEDVLRLKLVGNSFGGVSLVVVDQDGKRMGAGSLLHITKGGRIDMCDGIGASFGLDLDEAGRVRSN